MSKARRFIFVSFPRDAWERHAGYMKWDHARSADKLLREMICVIAHIDRLNG